MAKLYRICKRSDLLGVFVNLTWLFGNGVKRRQLLRQSLKYWQINHLLPVKAIQGSSGFYTDFNQIWIHLFNVNFKHLIVILELSCIKCLCDWKSLIDRHVWRLFKLLSIWIVPLVLPYYLLSDGHNLRLQIEVLRMWQGESMFNQLNSFSAYEEKQRLNYLWC